MAVASSGTAVVTVPTDTQIQVTREFDAPKHLVYRALTEPDLIRRWWSARRGEVTLCEHDLRPGGSWRQVMITPDGIDVGFHGTYREIVPNERLVYTELFEAPGLGEGDAVVNTVTLTENGGRTTMTIVSDSPKPEIQTAMLESGMEAGMQDAYDLLEEVAISLG
jgi:uncharacterized protein YndB with AHSA1/START domain